MAAEQQNMASPYKKNLLLAVIIALIVLVVPTLAHADETAKFKELLDKGWLLTYLGVFAAGVGTSLTPCVYPMIPIVFGIFGGKDASRGRSVLLASMYVLAMSLTFAALGMAAALAGKASSGVFLANPWFVVPVVVFYGVLASAMFGAFELQLPASWQAKFNTVGGKGAGGAFAMGLVGGLTAAPCTGPILFGILAFVASSQAGVPIGFTLLFTYGLGIGVLFFAIAIFAVNLPKSGSWMEGVKSVGGIALLVVAIYFLRAVLPWLVRQASPSTAFLLGAIALVVAGGGLGAIHLSFHDATKIKIRKAIGVAVIVVGFTGVVNWSLTPKRALAWRHDEKAALAEAQAAGAPMIIDFGAEWCAPCKIYETDVFADLAVHTTIADRFVPLKFDVGKQSDADVDAQKRWQARTLPTVILLDSEGKEFMRFGEPIPTPNEFIKALNSVP